MRIVVAPDSFKGSLSARCVADCCVAGIRRVIPDAEFVTVPMADGGEGTVEYLVEATGGHILHLDVTGPLGEVVPSFFGILGDGETAVIEMAAASGLPLVPADKLNPLISTTKGTGELLLAAAAAGCRRVIVGLGGSATNDGGAGMAQAIGISLLDTAGCELPPGGAALARLAKIDTTGLNTALAGMQVIVASDVNNPLTGPIGASAVYGPQKGATPAMVAELDAALAHYGQVIKEQVGKDIVNVPGVGAAGGLGAGLLAFLNAENRSGIEIMMQITRLEEAIAGADVVVTGEGCIDGQTANGKTLSGVARLARKYGKPLIGIAGTVADDAHYLHDHGFDCLFSILNKPMALAEATSNAQRLVTNTAEQIARCLVCGRQLSATLKPQLQQHWQMIRG